MIFGMAIRGNGQKAEINSPEKAYKKLQQNYRPVEHFFSQPKLTYSTPDSIKQNFKAIEKKLKPSLIVPE